MADPRVVEKPAAAAAPAAAPAETREIPSFSRVAADSRDARSSELAELAGVTTEPKTPPAGDAFDFDREWEKLPENFRTGITDRFNSAYNDALGREYGDVLPLAIEAYKNPNLRATLAAAAKDPELLELLADPKSSAMLKDLTKSELREFLFGEAKSTYEKYARPPAAGSPEPAQDPRDARIAKLESSMAEERDTRDTQGYIASRQSEFQALQSEFPELAKDRKALEHVINTAEGQFENAALRKGIRVLDDAGNVRKAWPAEALRAGVKPPSYREMHQYYAEVLGRSAPPSAPGTSSATPPAPPQAPRDASEGKTRALQLLRNSGGLKGLASASSRRK